MSAITVQQLKIRLGIDTIDTAEDVALAALIPQVQSLAEKSIGQPLSQAVRTEYHEGTDRPWINLRIRPVALVTAYGDTTTGGATLANLTTTTGIIVGMPVVGDGIPSGATVSSIGGGSVVMSLAATKTAATVRIAFGLSVWLNQELWANTPPGQFDATTLLTLSDYELRLDGSGPLEGYSSSGLLYRPGSYWPLWKSRKWGSLAPFIGGPVRDGGQTIKVVYFGGYPSALLPADIQLAIMDACALARSSSPWGTLVNSSSFDGFGYSLSSLAGAAWMGYLAGAGGAILNRYRRLVV